MNPRTFTWHPAGELAPEQVLVLLEQFDAYLPSPIGARTDLGDYAAKLAVRADIGLVTEQSSTVGVIALYANDSERRRAYVPFVSVKPQRQGAGIGKVLVSRALALARQRSMRSVGLEVETENVRAQGLYGLFGFRATESERSRVEMVVDLAQWPHPLGNTVTPLDVNPRLVAVFGLDIDLRVKRDDLYPMPGGGTKARKIEYIARTLVDGGYDTIVTTGGPQSNHARAAAIAAARLGIGCHLVLTPDDDFDGRPVGNYLLMRLAGATIEFCAKSELAERMDGAMAHYSARGNNPLYVWGGGHTLEGVEALVDAAKEAQVQSGEWQPDYVIVASGTGSTQAGLAIGYAATRTKVIGVSVARDAVTGMRGVEESVRFYRDAGRLEGSVHLDFRDDWTEGGYGKTSARLFEVTRKAAKAGLFVDPTYTGKSILGLTSLVASGEIAPRSKVLFWHSGGLMNMQDSIPKSLLEDA